MSFLSVKDVTEIRASVKQTTDTFFTIPAVISREGPSLDPFNEDRDDVSSNQITVNCLAVYETKGMEAMAKVIRNGTYDFDSGYALFNVEDLVASGLIDVTGTALIEATKDTIILGGEPFKIEGINPIGWFVDAFTLVKVHFQRQVKPK